MSPIKVHYVKAPEPTGRIQFAKPQDDIGVYGTASPEVFYNISEADDDLGFSIALGRDFALRAIADTLYPEDSRVVIQRLNGIVEKYGMKSPTKCNPSCGLFRSQINWNNRTGLVRALTANPQDIPSSISYHDNLKLVIPLDDLTKDAPQGYGNLIYVTAGSIHSEMQASALKEMFRTWVELEREHLVLG